MKFKRQGLHLQLGIAVEILLIILLLVFVFSAPDQIRDCIVYLTIYVLFTILLATLLIINAYDTVYCNEKGIKVVGRKKTLELAWEEVYKFERISGYRGGYAGFMIKTSNGDKFDCFPAISVEPKFIEYVKKTAPFIKFTVHDFTYSGK